MSEQTKPGWYPDPWGGDAPRWWDGGQWTAHVGTAPVVTSPAAPTPTPTPARESTAHIPVYNVWIWLVVFAPYVSILALPFLRFPPLPDLAAMDDPGVMIQWQLEFFLEPALIVATLAGWAGAVLGIVAAHRDWKSLGDAGLERPFHWAWVFLIFVVGPVYAIGRAVVVRQRTGRGIAVLWAAIGALVATVVITIVWMAVFMVDMFSQISELTGSSFG